MIVFGARDAPAAPFRLARHDHRIGARHRMAGAVFRRLPLVGAQRTTRQKSPSAFFSPVNRLFGLQFVGGELAPEADVVVHADRLIEALRPMRHDMLDQRPCADRLHIDALTLMELCLRHGRSALTQGKAATARLNRR
ncbi:MAG: hypothetical protein WDM81_07430 [Rhizomicrobium sp.]